MLLKRHLASVLVSAAIVGGGVATVAAADPGDSPTEEGRRPAGARHRQPLLGRAIHGDLIVRDGNGGFETVAVDRGKVQSKDGSKLTLERADGQIVTVEATDHTQYRGVASLEGIRTGAPAVVVSQDGKARVVAQRGNNRRGPAVEE